MLSSLFAVRLLDINLLPPQLDSNIREPFKRMSLGDLYQILLTNIISKVHLEKVATSLLEDDTKEVQDRRVFTKSTNFRYLLDIFC